MVEERLDGLLINVDRDVGRLLEKAEMRRDRETARCLGLLRIFVRFTENAYHAVKFVIADTPEDSRRKPKYALIVPPVNRQLLDLLFTLVYMLDDVGPRSLEYQRAGWRERYEEYSKFKTEFASNREWQDFLSAQRKQLNESALIYGITAADRKKLASIPYWPTPIELADRKTKSRKFLRWLRKWLYHDTSAQAHLSFGGLLLVAGILIADVVGGQDQEIIDSRVTQQYKFWHVSRTAFVTLCVLTEINDFLRLGNEPVVAFLWKMFTENVPEAKELFDVRYAPSIGP